MNVTDTHTQMQKKSLRERINWAGGSSSLTSRLEIRENVIGAARHSSFLSLSFSHSIYLPLSSSLSLSFSLFSLSLLSPGDSHARYKLPATLTDTHARATPCPPVAVSYTRIAVTGRSRGIACRKKIDYIVFFILHTHKIFFENEIILKWRIKRSRKQHHRRRDRLWA